MTGHRREVDFDVADADADADSVPADVDEELPAPAPRRGTTRTRVIAATVVALLAAALIARVLTRHDDTPPSAGAPSSASTSAATDPTPVLAAPPRISAPVRPLPPQFRPAGCPADAAVCATTNGLPDAALDALLRAFPHATLVQGVSLLAERAGRFGPDLVSRAFNARVGTTDISVYISKPSTAQAVSHSVRTYGKVSTTTSLRQSVPGFVVSIDVTQPAHNLPVVLDYMVQLANDDGLVIPQ